MANSRVIESAYQNDAVDRFTVAKPRNDVELTIV